MAADFLRWQVGRVRITAVAEVEWPDLDMTWLLPEATPDRLLAHSDWLRPHFVSQKGRINFTVQTFIVESRGRRIMVDTCVGNHKPRTNQLFSNFDTPFLERMGDAGYAPETIDVVVCTHLHLDHVGWNTRLDDGRWTPTFPNARYLIGRDDWALYGTQDHPAAPVMDDSVRPVIEAGLVEFVGSHHVITDEMRLEATPGHTPGHVCVCIESEGEPAVITGDLMHSPAQCAHPDWRCGADRDPEQAVATRRSFLARVADTATLVMGSHFYRPTAGWVVTDGDSYRLKLSQT